MAWSPRLWREIALIAVFYGAYTLVRLLIPHNDAAAYTHAGQVMRLEHALGPNIELKLNHALLHAPLLAKAANIYYATAHFAVTLMVLVWLYRARPELYRWLRTSLLLATGVALIGFWVYPLAPPRFLGGSGFVDPVTAFHSFGLYSSPQAGSLTNQFAAMPSMHAGWALWCAVALIVSVRRPLIKALAFLYPIVTITVIFSTANHYLLDAVAGVLVMTFALFVGLIIHLRENRPRTAKDHEVTNKTTIVESMSRSI
ncbi:phosphatase PAP2 family protein [Actinomadura sp. DC4]|uniref:phosphatase PAP2 family protein n=1 Tax=Actinomadura sp. DC4 TaxID=3055069 RepID=UPI0025B0D7CF|nr:phosphatase PAP2 family protein [Actinomadura sp. DC4]MDN3353267.1 phosphatase PAP2 family protein [Actinomadura sp. DC4]